MLTLEAQRCIIFVTLVFLSSKFQSVLLRDNLFSCRPFWDKCTEWPKRTLNPTRSKVPQIYFTSVHESHLFAVAGSFDTSVPNDPKLHWTLQGQRYSIYGLLVSPSPKFQSIALYDISCFCVTRHCVTSAPNDPKMTMNPTRSKVPYIYVTNVLA